MNYLTYQSQTQVISDMKRDLLFHIIQALKEERITLQDAQYESQAFLRVLHTKTLQELFQKMKKLSEMYWEIRTVFIKHANEYYERQKQQALQLANEYIQSLQLQQAVTVLKEATHNG